MGKRQNQAFLNTSSSACLWICVVIVLINICWIFYQLSWLIRGTIWTSSGSCLDLRSEMVYMQDLVFLQKCRMRVRSLDAVRANWTVMLNQINIAQAFWCLTFQPWWFFNVVATGSTSASQKEMENQFSAQSSAVIHTKVSSGFGTPGSAHNLCYRSEWEPR